LNNTYQKSLQTVRHRSLNSNIHSSLVYSVYHFERSCPMPPTMLWNCLFTLHNYRSTASHWWHMVAIKMRTEEFWRRVSVWFWIGFFLLFQRPYWNTKITWWTFDSSTARLIPTGCPTSWTSLPGHCHSSARKVCKNIGPYCVVSIIVVLVAVVVVTVVVVWEEMCVANIATVPGRQKLTINVLVNLCWKRGWRFGFVVTSLVASTKSLYAELG